MGDEELENRQTHADRHSRNRMVKKGFDDRYKRPETPRPTLVRPTDETGPEDDMNREELESHISETIAKGRDWIYLTMNGDPGSSRQRLLGHHWGPKGWVCGHKSPNNIVRFNALYMQEYMDELPAEKLAWNEDVACEIATQELLND